ncbi:hypothetical protein JZ751_003359 [Albula glossodonta]|uniref:Uncharacterized protein n=1 Tax=Albula glossodonta TaxID=121402 RepID=A0A8T2MUI6_9TELE|nr:hypothetical protein JZ751_003359 [Albula glossodonta]
MSEAPVWEKCSSLQAGLIGGLGDCDGGEGEDEEPISTTFLKWRPLAIAGLTRLTPGKEQGKLTSPGEWVTPVQGWVEQEGEKVDQEREKVEQEGEKVEQEGERGEVAASEEQAQAEEHTGGTPIPSTPEPNTDKPPETDEKED